MLAEAVARALRQSAHAVDVAADGEQADAILKGAAHDLVLLDIGLPGLNGFEVARRIRELPFGKDAVLVAVTGWGQEDDRNRSREAGFDAHLVKPVNHQELTRLLGSLPSHVGRS